METHPDLAVLAPVPVGLLEEGAGFVRRRGRIAFGSRAWEFWRRLDDLRSGIPVDVFIYASHSGFNNQAVTWQARYVGHVEGVDGKHPEGRKYRSPLALEDGDGWWAVFWEVDLMESIDPIPIAELRSYESDQEYGKPFVPEGPMLIAHP